MADMSGVSPSTSLSHEPLEFHAVSPLQATQLAALIREALETRPSIEIDQPTRSRRRLAGSVDGTRGRLTVWDENLSTRRRSWNIELDVVVEATEDGSVAHGTIDIPDRDALAALMRLFRVGAAMAGVLVVALSLQRGAVDIGTLGFAILVVAGTWLVTSRMKTEGETAPADDAKLVDGFLRRLIAAVRMERDEA